MNSEEREAVRVEMRNRIAALAKNLLEFDEFSAFASQVAGEGSAEGLWRQFRYGDITLDGGGWVEPAPEFTDQVLQIKT